MSIVTNVNSLIAQENLRVNNDFQGRTIQRLTSGYRINSSGDDAAGLAVANKFRSQIAELNQGVRNANDGLSAMQIVDGGLNNIAQIMDRLKTLATQSASATFTGNRATLQSEYNSLLDEIDRQASNIGLGVSGDAARYNTTTDVYIGGGGDSGVQANSKVSIDLSGSVNKADKASLGIGSTNISGAGKNLVTNAVDLRSGTFLSGATQALTFNFSGNSVTVSVGNAGTAMTGQQVIDSLNSQLATYGVSASMYAGDAGTGTDAGKIQFSGGTKAFTVYAADASTAGLGVVSAAGTGTNNTLSRVTGSAAYVTTAASAAETLTFKNSAGTTVATVVLDSGTTQTAALAQLNAALNSHGIYALKNSSATGAGIDFQSAANFTVQSATTGGGAATSGVFGADQTETTTAPTAGSSTTSGALDALTKLTAAVTYLGSIQGKVGTAQNKLQYAILLAQSQVSSYSSAESRIRDADVAGEAANLTKAQVMQQASLAAMAQANSAPQAILALLRG
jgi:flagellin